MLITDHRAKRVGHSVVVLLEADHEGVDKLDLVLENVDQAFDGLLLLDEVVAKPGGIDDCELGVGEVAQEMTLVLAGLLGHRCSSIVKAIDFEATVIKPLASVVLVSSHEDVGEAGFADASCAQNNNSGTVKSMLVGHLQKVIVNKIVSNV